MMSDTPIPDVVMAEVAAIETDQPCARCGYNLRGLKPNGQCPSVAVPSSSLCLATC